MASGPATPAVGVHGWMAGEEASLVQKRDSLELWTVPVCLWALVTPDLSGLGYHLYQNPECVLRTAFLLGESD